MILEELSQERRDELIEYVAQKISRYGMVTPAIMFFETARPLSFIGSQGVWFASPILGIFVNEKNIQEIAYLLEDRQNIDRLVQRLETIEFDNQAKQRELKEQRKLEKQQANQTGGKKKFFGLFQ